MADRVALHDKESEYALVGSLLAWPEVAAAYHDKIETEWFADDIARAFLAAAKKAGAAGGVISRQAIIGNLPELVDMPEQLGRLYGDLLDRAGPPNSVPGILSVVRDRWARRTLLATCKHVAETAPLYDCDPFDLTQEILVQADRVTGARKLREAGSLDDSNEILIAAVSDRKPQRGATTGFKTVDEKIGAYRPGQLYVIAGRPAMGKSTIGVVSSLKSAQDGNGVLFFSLEMTADEVSARALSCMADDSWAPTYSWILRRKVTDHQIDEMRVVKDSIAGLPLYFDYTPSLTLRDIAAEARRMKAEMASRGQSLDVVFVDHLTIIAPSDRYRGHPVMEVSQNIEGLRVLAKELDCAVVALCQLSRDVEKREDKRPQLSDLRWTGEIEQAAHVVAFVYREEYYLKNDPDADRYALAEARNSMDFLIRKNRQGETGDVRLWCDMAHSSVRDPK